VSAARVKAKAAPEPTGPMICGTCLAWRTTAERAGECRRAAPFAAANGAGVFPRTGEADWCLQWVDRAA
jgi:hypothetical protein